MTKIKNLQELFIDQLQDRYSAAQQQKKAFEKLLNATKNQKLQQILKDDIIANKSHLNTLKNILKDLNANPEGEYCEGTAGLVKEAIDTLHLFEANEVLDVAIAISIQHINHHDIAGYNSCTVLAKQMNDKSLTTTLQNMLEDEKKTDRTLTSFMEEVVAIS